MTSNSAGEGRKTPNSKSPVLKVDSKPEAADEQEKPIYLQLPPAGCMQEALKMLLFTVVLMAYLVCAVIHFIHTSDIAALSTALTYVSAYVGITQIAPLLHWNKKEGDQ